MLWVLVKKQLAEVFRSYFYDPKKNKMRSKAAIAAYFVFFFVVMVGVLGGMFAMLSLSLCAELSAVGLGWLYFLLMGGLAIVLGAFGSVFNTFTILYLAKDNDLLLSLPIPVRTIINARLINVYLLGTMYATTALIPALIVYWLVAGLTAARLLCGIALFFIVTFIVLLLSCLLGWVVARISLKLKNKSFITVLIALVFIGAYYFFYFRANMLIRDLIANAELYGTKIKGAAYGLYLFGRVGEGDWLATALFLVLTAALTALVWRLLQRSFLKIATASGDVAKLRYTEKPVRQKSVFGALLAKELGRFASSANYMLNCGLGVLMLPAMGVLLLVVGRDISYVFGELLAGFPGSLTVLLCAALCLLSTMNDMAAPSISLEAKTLWVVQSLPVEPKQALRAKAMMQILLTTLPMLFAALCCLPVVGGSLPEKLLFVLTALLFTVFAALAGTVIGVQMPLLNWTSETAPIKQSGGVVFALFGGWIVAAAFGGLYMLVGYRLGATLYLGLWALLFALVSLLLLRWLDGKGSRILAYLA